MPPFLETSETIQLVVEYVGFVPSRYYLKECSRYLNCEVNPVVQLNEADFLDAVDRKLVNPKFLRLEAGALSDALVSELSEERRCWTGWSITLDAALQGKSIDELRSAVFCASISRYLISP